jgi:hypothetical protein
LINLLADQCLAATMAARTPAALDEARRHYARRGQTRSDDL